ncbi:MAG: tyrosine--tRNA ligase, partial [Oscillospiraceae bacterium]|nr:tyrosine--tRNA ligase [Oscillospiraceae bacterium]
TTLVHGAEEAEKARAAAKALFAGGGDDSNMPTTELECAEDSMGILDVMTACGLAASRGEARRLIQQGGVSVDGEKVTSHEFVITRDMLAAGVKLRKGKKVFHKAILKA